MMMIRMRMINGVVGVGDVRVQHAFDQNILAIID